MKKILGMIFVMTLVLTGCGSGAQEPEKQVDPVVDETTDGFQWYENGKDAILVNGSVISFDLENEYFDAALEGADEYQLVVYNGKQYAMVAVKDGKLNVYDVPDEDEEVDESTAVVYEAVEKDYTVKDVNGPEQGSIKKLFDAEATIVKARKVIETESFLVTIKNRETEEISEVKVDSEFNVVE